MRQTAWWFRRSLLIAACCGAFPYVADAQSLIDVQSGIRVQLTVRDSLRQGPVAPARHIVIGRFVRATADSVWVRPDHASALSVARASITGASVSRGASRLRSALTFGAGVGFSLATTVAIEQIDSGRQHRVRDAAIAGGAGVVAGIGIGALSPYEHWKRIHP